jgi:hypothetical protein
VALDYSGVSAAAGLDVVDQQKTATGTTGSGGSAVSSGATAPSTAAGELALGFYADSGFSNALTGDPAYTVRTNVSPTGDMELLAQDKVLGAAGATANPVTNTGPATPWLAATLVLKGAAPAGGAAAAFAESTVAAKRVYAFAIPRPARPLPAGVTLLCPLAKWAQRLAPAPFTLHLVRPHPRTSKRHPRARGGRSASSSAAATRRGHRARAGARAR